MKRYIAGASLAFLSLSLIISSCKKHDDDNNSIVGAWEVSQVREVYITTNPPTTEDSTTYYTHGHSLVVTFTSGGRYISVDHAGSSPDTVSTGSYIYNNSRIITTDDGSSTPDTASATISGNVMTVTSTDSSFYIMTSTTTLNRQ